jgi:hypothetical protein
MVLGRTFSGLFRSVRIFCLCSEFARTWQYIQRIESQSESGHLMLNELVSLEFNRPIKPQQILVMKGTQDTLIQDKECEILAAIYQVKPILLDRLPHDLMLGKNWRLAADAILKWLKSEGLN